jgi:hypothetical protein
MRRSIRRRIFDFYILKKNPCPNAKIWLRDHPTLSPEECITNCGNGCWIMFLCRTHAIKMVRILTPSEKKLIADYNKASRRRLCTTNIDRRFLLAQEESMLYGKVWDLAYGLRDRDASVEYRDIGVK